MRGKFRSDKCRKAAGRRIRTARKAGQTERTRLTVYRSSKHIYAQLVDSGSGRTIATASSLSKKVVGDGSVSGKIEVAKLVGKAIAEIARENQIDKVVFNRNGFLYHGRVKALAEAAREAGLQF